MVLIRLITLEALVHNVKITAKHVPTEENGKSDALSRLDFKRFWDLAPDMNPVPTKVPDEIWPPEKIWLD